MLRSIVCLFLACYVAACAAERAFIPGCGKFSCIILVVIYHFTSIASHIIMNACMEAKQLCYIAWLLHHNIFEWHLLLCSYGVL